MYIDYHVHSEFSDDSEYPVEDVVKDAIKLGLKEICFTDHVDYGVKKDHDDITSTLARFNVDYPTYYEKIKYLQDKYKEDISIKLGLEFGIQTHTIPMYESLIKRYPFDFILLSIHEVDDLEFWTQDYQKGKTQKEYNEGYYKELLNVVKNYHDYSVLAHLDLITRYDKCGIYPFENVKDTVIEILKTVIKDGKGIEINTSSHRYGLNDLTPSREILKLYKELNGQIITIGSDSHKKEHLGTYIEESKKELKELGFEYYCTYDKLKPIFHKL